MPAWLIAALLVASPAAVDDLVDVQWSGSGECRDEATLRSRVQGHLDPQSQLTPVSTRLHTDGHAPNITAELTITSEAGESSRVLEAASCEELLDAVALVVAMTLDPTLDLSRVDDGSEATPDDGPIADPDPDVAPPEPETPPPSEPDTSLPSPTQEVPPEVAPTPKTLPETTRPPEDERPTRPRAPVVGAIGEVAAGVSGGRIPSPSAILGIAGGITIGPWRILATHRYELPRTRALDEGSIVLWSWGLGLRGCYGARRGRFDIAGCAVFDAGQVRGRGDGLPTKASAGRPWIGIGPRVELQVGLAGRWSAFAAIEGHGHVLQPRFHVEGIGEVFRTRTIGGSATLGVAVGLW